MKSLNVSIKVLKNNEYYPKILAKRTNHWYNK